MKLAANVSLLYREQPLAERIAAAARDGFDGVEILFPYDVPTAALRGWLQDAGLPLALINTPLGTAGERGHAAVAGEEAHFLDGLRRALDVAAVTGCATVHVLAGAPAGGDASVGEAFEVLAANLRRAAPLARQAGVTLTLEPLNRHDAPGYAYHLPRQAAQVVERLGLPEVRLQFDLYHAAREGLDAAVELQAVRRVVHHVQIADAPLRSPPDLSKPGTRRALETLLGWPYSGWLGFEYVPPGATADSLGWREPLRRLLLAREASAP